MPRELCSNCHYPIKTCLCEFIKPVAHKTRVIILQHPSEVKNAKNTVRLLKLISNNIMVHIGESEADFIELRDEVDSTPQNFALIFPSDKSIQITNRPKNESNINNIILLDGTWKKAKKIMFLNPWLNNITHLTFNAVINSEYKIRKSNVEGGLSTLESTAHCLFELENTPAENMINSLNGLNNKFTALMPSKVSSRYGTKTPT